MKQIEKTVYSMLEDMTLEDILETFDIDPVDVVQLLFEAGMIDEDILERYCPVDS